MFVACTPANISDDKGLIQIIKANLNFFKKKKVNTPKITVLLDNGYHKQKLEKELQEIYPQILTKIRIQITPKPSKDKDNPGFKPVHKRWVVERTNAWVEKCRVLWKNCERHISTSVAKLQLCLIRLQIKRLARGWVLSGFYIVLALKEDYTREVIGIYNNPTRHKCILERNS